MAKKKEIQLPKFRINDDLKGNYDVRITGENIKSEVVSLNKAKSIAESMDLDLIEINANTPIPIMRIASYEKMMYGFKKNAKKKKQNTVKLKEIQLTVNISEHDLATKANHAKKFLEDGNKVKVTLTMKGREVARREENKKSLLQFIVMLEEEAVPEAQPKDDGNRTIVILKKKG